MRLWSLHPKYFETEELKRVWKWGMAALNCKYVDHPQMIRFIHSDQPIDNLAYYLHCIGFEAFERGLRYPKMFNRLLLPPIINIQRIPVTAGQMEFEVALYAHALGEKRGQDNIDKYFKFMSVHEHEPNPVFYIVRGAIEKWERLPPHDYTTCKKPDCETPVFKNHRGQPSKYCTLHKGMINARRAGKTY